MKGKLFCFEGLDKSGKSTVAKALVPWLVAQGIPALYVKAPGQTAYGRVIRQIVLNQKIEQYASAGGIPNISYLVSIPTPIGDQLTTELLHMSDLRETATQVIEPALLAGTHVICDRFEDSTRAYASAHGVDDDWIDDMLLQILPAWIHDAIHIYFKQPAEVTLARIKATGVQDGGDGFDDDFYRRVAYKYDELFPKSHLAYKDWWEEIVHIVDSTQPLESLHNAVREIVLFAVAVPG